MKRFFLPLVVMALFVIPCMGQNDVFSKGDKVVNLAIGLGNRLYSGSSYSNVTPAISGSFEVGVQDDLFDANSSLGIGAYLGYTGSKYTYGSGNGSKINDVIIGARGAVHYQFIPDLDTYGGLMLGYDIVSSETFGPGPYFGNIPNSGIEFALYAGGRYYFTDQLAGLLELGYGIAYVNIGVAIKL